MSKFNNRYRIESNRLQSWDYTNSGYYFITLITKNRKHFFGDINNSHIMLSRIGKIVKEKWLKTEILRDEVILDKWQIMPNHFHAIIILDNKKISENSTSNKTLLKNSLGSIIGQFKSVVTKRVRKMESDTFGWQRNYYDHIIRNEKALYNIRRYIE